MANEGNKDFSNFWFISPSNEIFSFSENNSTYLYHCHEGKFVGYVTFIGGRSGTKLK